MYSFMIGGSSMYPPNDDGCKCSRLLTARPTPSNETTETDAGLGQGEAPGVPQDVRGRVQETAAQRHGALCDLRRSAVAVGGGGACSWESTEDDGWVDIIERTWGERTYGRIMTQGGLRTVCDLCVTRIGDGG